MATFNWPLLDLTGFPLPFDLGTSFVKWFTCGTLVHVTNIIAKDCVHNGNMCTNMVKGCDPIHWFQSSSKKSWLC
jgi:hypothetical protein